MDSVGSNLTPIPDACCVLRLARPPKDFAENGNISAIQLNEEFTLSSDDKMSYPPHLSVWVDSLTTPEQAYKFLAENSPRKLVLRLKVNEICKIQGNFGESTYPNLLNVIWVHLFDEIDGKRIRDCRAGADGHSGIIGLDEKSVPEGLSKNQQKILRKDLRSKLAELASKDCFQIPDL
ncbi:MAG: hypothetical protein EAZ09_16085 [Oscillatoriales cyanobacterium]|nr:MAG: hypothetical protein EAZ18_13375 [Oscillatoriales cyanobacterium]TAH19460.1 MAG: hypothetical protein EAZ09_16085 [Oscillatoriales cyanobacterium]